jgi:hypothetical protein
LLAIVSLSQSLEDSVIPSELLKTHLSRVLLSDTVVEKYPPELGMFLVRLEVEGKVDKLRLEL